ncbi:MAG: sugar phosphate isomerase/epimerase family protein, partial [Bacteroidota bacterium]|nr:sugar phosphate isomerase/epimerase family protein [Bacteroidota bacterium]
MNRRIFIKNSSIIAISSAIPSCVNNNTNSYRRNKIGVSSYSFWHFDADKKPTMGYCIEKAARMGFDGIEFLLVQMSSTENTHLQKLKKKAFHAGLDIMGLSTHQGFLNPSKEYRDENINKTIDQIEIAYQLGIPTMRINTGRWGTSESFDALMANKGIEPPIDGYNENDGFPWVIESIEKCIPTAEKCGVVLGLENHWGLGISAKNVKRIIDEINSPWLRATLDTGNFLEDRDNQIQT